jgi:alpha-galactosidase
MRNLLSIIILFIGLVTVFSQKIQFNVNNDGTFNIIGTSVKILNCYPAIDNRMLKPLSVKIITKNNQKIIQYFLVDGKFEIILANEGDAVTINTNILINNLHSEFISPIHDAIIENASRIYRTPATFMGKGGVKEWPSDKLDFSISSLIAGMIPDSGATMVISTRDYSKFQSFVKFYPSAWYGGKKMIDAYISTEMIQTDRLPTFYITENRSAFDAMKNEASEVAKIAKVKNDKPQSYHWCSWYYAYYHLSDEMLSDYLKGFKTVTPNIPIQTIQIDAGYAPHVGDWLEPFYKFPKGLEKSIKEIIDSGYRAGIWIGPYMVGNKSKLYKEHPDWILCKKDGSPIIKMTFYGEERLWGQMDEEIYVLDTSNPEVMEYLRQVFRTFRKMGITFFKTDFMLYGSESSENVKRFAPGKTSIEYQHDFFEMIRQEIGSESYWLGCIAPFASMIGYVDGMRISADIRPMWEGGKNMFDESIGAQHINNIWWQNDPDAIILREKYNHMNNAETQSMILWMGMLGGVINTSDLFHDIPKNRVDLFRFLEPCSTKLTSKLPFIDKPQNFEVLVRKYPTQNSYAVLFVNRNNEKKSVDFIIEKLINTKSATCYDWRVDEAINLGVKSLISIELNPHESKLVYMSIDGKSPNNMNLGGKL